MSSRIHTIHKQINSIEKALAELRSEIALLHADSSEFETLPELETVVVEEDG